MRDLHWLWFKSHRLFFIHRATSCIIDQVLFCLSSDTCCEFLHACTDWGVIRLTFRKASDHICPSQADKFGCHEFSVPFQNNDEKSWKKVFVQVDPFALLGNNIFRGINVSKVHNPYVIHRLFVVILSYSLSDELRTSRTSKDLLR